MIDLAWHISSHDAPKEAEEAPELAI